MKYVNVVVGVYTCKRAHSVDVLSYMNISKSKINSRDWDIHPHRVSITNTPNQGENDMSNTFTSSSYYYTSATNTTDGTTATGHRYTTTSHTEPDGTTVVRTAKQDLGQPVIVEERRYDRTGQEQLALEGPGGSSAGGVRRITELDKESAPSSSGTNMLDDDNVDRGSWDLSTTPSGMRLFDSKTGAYVEHEDYQTDHGMEHHRQMKDVSGRRFRRDVDIDTNRLTTAREHREYENPGTGTKVEKDDDVDVSDII